MLNTYIQRLNTEANMNNLPCCRSERAKGNQLAVVVLAIVVDTLDNLRDSNEH